MAFFLLIFEINKQACDSKIIPSFKTLKSLAFKVFPVDVISVIISDEPVNGYVSVAPKLLTSLNWVTPLENKKSLVKFGYFVATLKRCFLLSLNSKATSSKSAIVWTSIHLFGIATTSLAFPKLYFLNTDIFFWMFTKASFNKSYPEKL